MENEEENRLGLSLLLSPKKIKPILKREDARRSLTKNSPEMKEKLQQMCLEKEKTEALLKEQENATQSLAKQLQELQEKLKQMRLEMDETQELLKEREEELQNRGKEREKLQLEVNKLRKLKEFKPTLSFPLIQEDVSKKACPEKRPSSAYMLWRKDQWNMVKKENPNAEFKESCNILRMKWNNLSAEEKKPYEERYRANKESYTQIIRKEHEKEAMDIIDEKQRQKAAMELLEQYLLFKKEADKESNKARKERDPLKPKQPLSAFFLFLNECRPALLAEKKSVVEIAKIAGKEWKNMTEEEQAPYREIAKTLKGEHLRQMEHYKQKCKEKTRTGESSETGSSATAIDEGKNRKL